MTPVIYISAHLFSGERPKIENLWIYKYKTTVIGYMYKLCIKRSLKRTRKMNGWRLTRGSVSSSSSSGLKASAQTKEERIKMGLFLGLNHLPPIKIPDYLLAGFSLSNLYTLGPCSVHRYQPIYQCGERGLSDTIGHMDCPWQWPDWQCVPIMWVALYYYMGKMQVQTVLINIP